MNEQMPKTSWWQRPQPVWFTALISMAGVFLLLGAWNWGQAAFASAQAEDGRVVSGVASQATTLSYQGFVANSNGAPLSGNHNFIFRLFPSSSGGTAVWTETHNNVPVSDGLFEVQLGSKTTGGLPDTVWQNPAYLEVVVNDQVLTPRELVKLDVANMALAVANGSITSNALKLSTGTSCRTSSIPIDFPGGSYVFTEIPELVLPFDLTEPSKVLLWMDGLARYDTDGEGESGILLELNGNHIASTLSPIEGRWFGVKGQRLGSLEAGSYTLKAIAYASMQGTMTVHGNSDPHRLCINYIVLGK